MSITKSFNHGRVVYQTADSDDELCEPAVLVHVDNGGFVLLSQDGREIVLNRATLKDLVTAIKAGIRDYESTLLTAKKRS